MTELLVKPKVEAGEGIKSVDKLNINILGTYQ